MSGRATNEQFSELALPLFESLYNFAHWLARDRSEAEDLVQETYAKALKGFSSFELGTNFRAWMFRILRNTWLTSRTGLQARMTVPIEEDTPEPFDAHTPETTLLGNLDRDAIEHAIGDLPPAFREVLLLCDVEEMSYADIAQTLGIPVGTVMSRLSRARKRVRESLEENARAVQHSGR
jgi:RNA polymerase sigma-70 factor, ECF subfamily